MLLQVRDNSEALGRALDRGWDEYQSTLRAIEHNSVYKQILSDSIGGMMYNVANRGKYDTTELNKLWNSFTSSEQAGAGGIVRGAMRFMNEVN